MARQPEEIDDPTPLTGERIDIGARIGWLLRTTRIAAGAGLRELAERAGDQAGAAPLSAATLSRTETLGRRRGAVVAAYERTLGLPYGQLRAPIDVLCRTFAYAPADLEPFRPPADLTDFTAACAAVAGTEPDGHDWLRFAEHHTAGPFGLPADAIRPALARLAGEVGRATGTAYQLRYEALAKLRCSPYRDVVLDVVRELVAEPGVQRAADLVSAATELASADAAQWCGELLRHPSWVVARAGCLGIQNLRSVGELDARTWTDLVPVLAAACDADHDDPLRGPMLAATLACCPPGVRTEVRALLRHEPPEPRRTRSWTRTRHNVHFNHAGDLAARICAGRAGETLLARMLFELLYDFRATHVVTSSFLLTASPYAGDVADTLCHTALHGPDELTRHGAAYAFANLMPTVRADDPGPWLASDDPVIRGAGLIVCGFAGVPLPADLLTTLLRSDPELARDTLFAAGMAQQPELSAVADDEQLPGDVREAARWWLRTGGRILR
ncbi:hypothetical protein KG112_08535 [Nocardioides sp. zg-ZUI104]|uniref:hypothetical protein n=1 Tax=Nocardioides faecalis TaxID=2803858 RepID=UPI001BCE677E|nr:hypothetical protein [Nocardioides faecalis]MBS4752851.1 hypothetical protein [Nocardioides faecalis]